MTVTDDLLLSEIAAACQSSDDWKTFIGNSHTPIHIAVMTEPFLSYVLEGVKTVESRFSLHKIAPYQKVTTGDKVLLKAGPIVGGFTAGWVKNINLLEQNILTVKNTYGNAICGDEVFWQEKADKRYGTLLEITDLHPLSHLRLSKFDRRAWVTLRRRIPS